MYRTKCHSHKPKKGKGSYDRVNNRSRKEVRLHSKDDDGVVRS